MSLPKCSIRIQIITLIGLAALTACASTSSSTPTSTMEPITITPAPTETGTATVLPTSVLTATPPPTPEPTLYPPLIWVAGLSPIPLGSYSTVWSPTSNELLLDNCVMSSSRSEILRADSPEFIPQVLNNEDVVCNRFAYPGAIWTPDGQQIVFSGDSYEEGTFVLTSIWIMGKDGSNPRSIAPEENTGRNLKLTGWIAPDILAYQTYLGGGARTCAFLNINSGQIEASSSILGFFYVPIPDYLAGTRFAPDAALAMVLSPEPGRNPPITYGGDHVYTLPLNTFGDSRFNNSYFRDWRQHNPEMLVQFAKHGGETADAYYQITRLVLWDLESDSVSILCDGGVDGQFSPDGSRLAYLTLGPPWLDGDHKPTTDKYEPIPLDGQHHLNLLDMTTGVVSFSVPIFEYQIIYEDNPARNIYELNISFSPDGQYLAYFSPADDEKAMLNVLDLTSLQVVYSEPADTFFLEWSPDSSRLIYRDRQMNLAILGMDRLSSKSLTLDGGQRIFLLDWSFDGQYITLSMHDSPGGQFYTAVLELPDE